MPGYGARYWAERTPAAKRPRYPSLRGDLTADVVVIGGGLTGATAAYVLAKDGFDVVLIEADRLASGGTSAGIGAIVPEPAASYRPVEARVGIRRARAAWQTARAGALEFASALRRLGVRCDLEPVPLLTAAFRADGTEPLKREQAARRAAGLDAAWLSTKVSSAVIGGEAVSAIKQRESFLFDPVRATLGMVRAAESAGARIFEHSAARRTTFTRKTADVVLASGRVHARGVFVATSGPGALFRPLVRHVRTAEGYVVVTEPLTPHMRRSVGRRDSVVVEANDDPRWMRWLDDGRVLFAGVVPVQSGPRQGPRVLIQRTGQLMYELSLRHPVVSGLPGRWSWQVPVVSTLDGLPWIGAHRNYPFHFFSLATGWQGDGLAWFAAKSGLRHFRGESVKTDEVFAFSR